MPKAIPPQSHSSLSTEPALLRLYQDWLPTQVISQLLSESQQTFYQRILPPVLVLWGFIFQRLNPDHSCDAAWSHLSSDAVRERFGLPLLAPERLSASTSAYCQARQRLPASVAQGVLQSTAQACQQTFGAAGLWHGYRVNLFDGSTLLLAATPALRAHYGTASNQHGASHWPLLRWVVGFDLQSGVANAVSEGPYRMGEHSLAVELIRQMGSGWLHVGDRNFGVYHILQACAATRTAALLRLKVRAASRLAGQPLQPGMDLDVVWSASKDDTCESDLDKPAVAGRLIYARLARAGFRPLDLYLFTTLTERTAFPSAELVALYGQRQNLELDLRHVKTTLQMERLTGRSVELVRKELLLGLAAYNLLRGLMGLAALKAQRRPLELSLAQCWRRSQDAGRSLTATATPAEVERVLERLLIRLGRCVLPKRKRERFEPRAVWGRPRVYPAIKGSRAQTRQAQLDLLKANS